EQAGEGTQLPLWHQPVAACAGCRLVVAACSRHLPARRLAWPLPRPCPAREWQARRPPPPRARYPTRTSSSSSARRSAPRDGEALHAWRQVGRRVNARPNLITSSASSLPAAALAVLRPSLPAARDAALLELPCSTPLSHHHPRRAPSAPCSPPPRPVPHSFAAAFTAAARARSASAGAAHAFPPSAASNVFVSTALLSMYRQAGPRPDARRCSKAAAERVLLGRHGMATPKCPGRPLRFPADARSAPS
ncbi:hypothetical protein ZWY2020_014068, partial [Hordeum vulgare]